MILKDHTALRELPKCGRVLFADEIRTHPVPNHNHHMAIRISGQHVERNDAGEDRDRNFAPHGAIMRCILRVRMLKMLLPPPGRGDRNDDCR